MLGLSPREEEGGKFGEGLATVVLVVLVPLGLLSVGVVVVVSPDSIRSSSNEVPSTLTIDVILASL